jgi:lipid-A-disaccharide synthase-like uncharacterized protein
MDILFVGGKFLGIEWHVWKVIGWVGNCAFFSRFIIQWYASEKKKHVVIPVAFWWLSLVGSLSLLSYALFYKHDSVFIFANLFNWVPYIRNLMIHHQHKANEQVCPSCAHACLPAAKFCSDCGTLLVAPAK